RQSLSYARREAGNWALNDIEKEATNFAGEYVSIVVDADKVAHVAYWSLGGLKYAKLSGAPATWTIEPVEAGSGIGLYPSLRIDLSGQPQMVYYDSGKGDLKHATHTGQGWKLRTADAGGDVGGYASMVLDEFNAAHIAYYDWDARNLRIVHSNRAP